jgi:hypothetical protein
VLAIALITAASIGATKFHEVAGTPSEVSQITP